jgi:hypothetical protein
MRKNSFLKDLEEMEKQAKQDECKRCNGYGIVNGSEEDYVCVICNGTGINPNKDQNVQECDASKADSSN